MRIIIVTGAPGVGKTETARLVTDSYDMRAVCLETDDVARTSPWEANEALYCLMGRNVAACLPNFQMWGAGVVVIAGALLPERALPWVWQAIEATGFRLACVYALVAEQEEIRRRIMADPKPQQKAGRLAWTYLDDEARNIPGAVTLDTTFMPLSNVAHRIAIMESTEPRPAVRYSFGKVVTAR